MRDGFDQLGSFNKQYQIDLLVINKTLEVHYEYDKISPKSNGLCKISDVYIDVNLVDPSFSNLKISCYTPSKNRAIRSSQDERDNYAQKKLEAKNKSPVLPGIDRLAVSHDRPITKQTLQINKHVIMAKTTS